MAGMTGFTIETVDIRTATEARDALQTLTGADRLSADYIKDGSVNHMMSVFQDSLVDANTLAHYKLTRNTTTQIQAEKIDNERDFVVVNGEIVSLSTAITCDLTDNLIAADGTDAGSAPLAATAYHIYLSNSSASFAPSDVRLSATAPASGEYLAASGNGANWRRIGYLKTDSATATLTNDWQICGKGIDVFMLELGVSLSRSAGDAGWYNDLLNMNDVVFMDRSSYLIIGQLNGGYSDTADYTQGRITKDSTPKASKHTYSGVANYTLALNILFAEKSISNQDSNISLEYKYIGANTLYIDNNIDSEGQRTMLQVIRITI